MVAKKTAKAAKTAARKAPAKKAAPRSARKSQTQAEPGNTLSSLTERDYETTVFLGENGRRRRSKSNGDAIAKSMMGLTEAQLFQVAKANGLGERYGSNDKPNVGMFRMALGNSLRAMVRRGEPVTVTDNVIKKLDQRVNVSVEQVA